MVEGKIFLKQRRSYCLWTNERRTGKELVKTQLRYNLCCTPFIVFLIQILGLFLSIAYFNHVYAIVYFLVNSW